MPAKAAADAPLTGALANINAVAENCPDLKSSTNFLDLFFTGIAGVHSRDFYPAPEGQEHAPQVHF